MKKFFIYSFIFVAIILPLKINAQFAPAAGQVGSTAIHKDSSIFIDWAKTCIVERGYINIEDKNQTYTQGELTSNRAFFGKDENAVGMPQGAMDIVSFGDGGSAIITFNKPIKNGLGADFAIFSNGFLAQTPPNLFFLELAFVEVSSNGIDYIRFPATSLTQVENQVGTYGQINPEKIHNLASKYIYNYGTPFDLEDLIDSVNIDIQNVTHIKLIDVIGSINSNYASYDSQGNIINDPWSTPFWTCGFDLDAVGVINNSTNFNSNSDKDLFIIYPNPVFKDNIIHVKFNKFNDFEKQVEIYDVCGKLIFQEKTVKNKFDIDISNFNNQLYFIYIKTENYNLFKKIIITK